MVTIRKPKTALKFKKPAAWWISTWRGALPCGNGKIGAAVFGGTGDETILINHGDLWWQGHVGVLPDVADKLKEVRKALDNGAPKDAENVLTNALISKSYRPQMAYPLPLCCLKVKQPIEKPVKEYMRVLNMENGEISVVFKDGTTKFDRSLFVSRANDLICYEITKNGSKPINVEFSIELPDKLNARTPQAISKLPEGATLKCENYFIYFSARSDNGTEYGAVARINYYGGSMDVKQESIAIKDAERIQVLVKPFVESQREKEWKAAKQYLTGIKLPYEKLLKEHTPLHQKIFSGIDFDLDADNRDAYVEDLIDNAQTSGELSPALVEKLWAFGRYLFVSATSESSRPLAPYGLWCGDYKAIDSNIDAFGSIQMLYSQALSGGLQSFLLSLFRHYEAVMDDLKKNATRLYSCRGIFVPAHMAPSAGFVGTIDPKIIHFTGIAGWISRMMFDYYLYTDDKRFLKEQAIPFMKETALFYEEFFKIKADGFYESSPSYSPCNTPSNYYNNHETLSVAKNAVVDFEIAKELLKNLIKASNITNSNKNDIPKWTDMLTRIPSYQFNADNTIKEYLDYRYNDSIESACVPHLYSVYPGAEIDGTEPELHKAFLATAKKRASVAVKHHTSLSLVNFAHIFARLGEGETAFEFLQTLARCNLMDNLITLQNDWRGMGIGEDNPWTAYTLEGNCGLTSAVQEMLASSTETTLKILPAIPSSWTKGSAMGICTKLGVEVNLDWDSKKGLLQLKLKAKKAVSFDLQLPAGSKRYKGSGTFVAETSSVKGVELPSGKITSFEIRF